MIFCQTLILYIVSLNDVTSHFQKKNISNMTLPYSSYLSIISHNIKRNEMKKILISSILFSSFILTNANASLNKKETKSTKYTIKNGDTLFKIARKHHTTVEEVRKANHFKKGQILKLGKVLKVPTDTYFPKEKISKRAKSSKTIKITRLAKTKLGQKYVWGAIGRKNTFDCSGFTSYVYKKNGIRIPRTSREQSKYGTHVSRKNLKPGDLVFFDTSKKHKGYVNHVGIYLGGNKFIHASSAKKKVIITSLNKKFYSQRYKGARRPKG